MSKIIFEIIQFIFSNKLVFIVLDREIYAFGDKKKAIRIMTTNKDKCKKEKSIENTRNPYRVAIKMENHCSHI